MEIKFLVEGSTPEPYEVTFIKDDNKLYVTCTCQDAENRLHCKHRINILKGETKNIVSDNEVEVEKIKEWLSKSYLDFAFASYLAAERFEAEAKAKYALCEYCHKELHDRRKEERGW